MGNSGKRAFGSSYPPKADPEMLARYPSRRPSDPALVPAYEQGQLKLLQLLFQHLPDGVVATDPEGLITEANPAAAEIFGRMPEELVNQPIFQHLEDEHGTPLSEVIGREITRFRFVRNRHVYVKRPDGTRRSCTLSAGPLIQDGFILRAFGIFRDRTELEQLVQIDDLTGLLNKRAFEQRLREQILMARRKDEPLALAYLDLRRFKELNDRFGHAEGDRVIKQVGHRIDTGVFDTDFKARSNRAGDEFLVLFTRIVQENVPKAAKKLVAAVTFEAPLIDPETGRVEQVPVSADIGIVWRRGADIPDAEALIEMADKCMYGCKKKVKAGETHEYCLNVG